VQWNERLGNSGPGRGGQGGGMIRSLSSVETNIIGNKAGGRKGKGRRRGEKNRCNTWTKQRKEKSHGNLEENGHRVKEERDMKEGESDGNVGTEKEGGASLKGLSFEH